MFVVKTLLASLRDELVAGTITMRTAQESLYKAGWFNYLPSEEQVRNILYL